MSRVDDRPLVSLITIVRDGAETLEQAMRSVLEQDYEAIEYIVIDGGSTDGTLDIIRRHQQALGYWVSEPDEGIADAFNKGIRRSRGEWIAVVNADDWLEPGAVRRVVAAIDGSSVVHGWQRVWLEDGSTEIHRPRLRAMLREMSLLHGSCFVRRDLFDRYGLYDTSYRCAMDYEFLLRLYRSGERFRELPAVLVNVRPHGVSQRAWIDSRREARRAKIQHGVSPARAWVDYVWQLLRRGVRRVLELAGLERLVRAYRARHTPVRKLREGE